MTDQLPARQAATTASTACSPALWTLLTENRSRKGWFERIDDLRRDPKAVEAIKAALPALQGAAQPAEPKVIVRELAKMVPIFGVADRSSAEWATFWRFYLDVLADVPPAALKAACTEYVAAPDSNFFPRPGPLKAICDRHAADIRTAARLAERALQPIDRAAPAREFGIEPATRQHEGQPA